MSWEYCDKVLEGRGWSIATDSAGQLYLETDGDFTASRRGVKLSLPVDFAEVVLDNPETLREATKEYASRSTSK